MRLSIEGLSSGYGKVICCRDISMIVGQGERVCLLGRNGVGKTTLIKTIVGLLPVKSGSLSIDERNINRLPTFKRARLGIGYVPQGRDVFPRLTVRDNLRLGTISHYGKIVDFDPEVLRYFPVLAERLNQKAGTLSGGEQQMLSIARALVGKPKLLLLDEPSEGIQPSIVQLLSKVIMQICRDQMLATLIVEQKIDFALSLAERGYVMEKGSVVAEAGAEQLRNEEVVKTHLSF